MRRLPKFISQEEEAVFWMKNDTAEFWNTFEDVKTPLEITLNLQTKSKSIMKKQNLLAFAFIPVSFAWPGRLQTKDMFLIKLFCGIS